MFSGTLCLQGGRARKGERIFFLGLEFLDSHPAYLHFSQRGKMSSQIVEAQAITYNAA